MKGYVFTAVIYTLIFMGVAGSSENNGLYKGAAYVHEYNALFDEMQESDSFQNLNIILNSSEIQHTANINKCTTISSPGYYVLNQSIMNTAAESCINIISSDVVFDGAGYTIDGNDTEYTYGVYVYNSTTLLENVTVKNLIVTDWFSGISYDGVSNGSMINNTASSNGVGIFLWFSSSNTIINNTASSNGAGIVFEGSSNNNMTYNNAHLNIDGILINASSNNTLISNTANSNSEGITLAYSSNSVLINNTANSNSYFGIWLRDSSEYNTIDSNTALNNYVGTYLLFSDNNNLSNNTANSNSYFGIWLDNSSNYSTIDSNTASNNYVGILLSSSDSNKLTSNTANLNELAGIYIEATENVSINNTTAMDNSNSGFILYDSHNITLLKNTAIFNDWVGILLSYSNMNELKSNNASNNAYFGIFIISSNQSNLTNNTVDSNYYFGVAQYQSNNNSIDNDFHNITEDIQGVRLYINENITPSLQSTDNSSNATYSLWIENLGIIPDTFEFNISNPDKSSIAYLDKQNISLNPGQRANLTLYVGDVRPGGYAVSVKVVSEFDENISDTVETLTIVTGVESQSSTTPLASIEGNRMLLNTLNEASPCQSPSSAFINSKCMNSIFDYSAVENSTIENSTIIMSMIFNSTAVNSTLSEIKLEDALIINNSIIYGNITIKGITYSPSNFQISNILIGYDKRKSNLVGMTEANKTLEVYAADSNVSFNISTAKDYFAASLEIQRSSIQPVGVKQTDNVGGYINVEASKNLKQGAGFIFIKIYYDESALGTVDENTLKVQFYNTSSQIWEVLSDSGVNTIENYVWANTTHFSVFALAGAKATKVQDSGVGGEGGRGVVTSEPHDNIARYETEIRDVISNKPVIYNFIAPEHGIYELVVTGKESEKDIAIRIEALRGISRLTASLPPGIVYTNINIWAGTEQIKEVLIRFKMENSWISKYASGKVKMLRWDKSKWVQLKTQEKNKDSTYTYYEAKTDSFSAFVITLIEDVVTPASTPAIEQAEIPKPIETATQAVIPAKKAAGFEVILVIIALLVLFWQVRNRK